MDLSKSGFKTTEFWLAIATITAGTLVLLGKLDTYNYPMATDIISKTLESITIIIAQSAIVYKYMCMRHHAKVTIAEARKNNHNLTVEVTPEQAEKLKQVVSDLEIPIQEKENK